MRFQLGRIYSINCRMQCWCAHYANTKTRIKRMCSFGAHLLAKFGAFPIFAGHSCMICLQFCVYGLSSWRRASLKRTLSVSSPFVGHFGGAGTSLSWNESLFYQIKATPEKIVPRVSLARWSPPGDDEIKLNFDGAMLAASSEIGVGVVARDSRWVPEPKLVEGFVSREAVLLARRFGWRRIVLERDCANLHLKLSSPQADCAATSVVTRDIKRIISDFECYGFSLVPRTNKIAHCLARKASSSVLEGLWFPPLLAEHLFSGFDK
ncbi:UNVERIFIED_CONTAM: hypothetical protein Sradi_4103900 [Sesamum radiatum]|uniref:RNase H type-1 domain-containing protein n=1 Tax=Sesamum radiatum TaxID=300843 RepID=A0AAW2P0E4_SESRA